MSGIPKNINFLLTEDFFATRKLLKEQLISFGFSGEIIEAENVAVARDIIVSSEIKFDFFLSDMETPHGSGLDLITFVRGIESYKTTPFIIISAVNEMNIILKCIQLGATNYLIKPWSKEGFREKLEASWKKSLGR